MLEFPEVITLSQQLNREAVNQKVEAVLPPTKAHKFCFFNGDPSDYGGLLKGGTVTSVSGFGLYVELHFDNGMHLCFNDGVNVRLIFDDEAPPKNYQLLIRFENGASLCFTVAMYGGIILHNGNYDNIYYQKSIRAVSPFSMDFMPHYFLTLLDSTPTISAKAFLATEQRFPGVGNGVLQDVLFKARIHPKRQMKNLSESEKFILAECMTSVLEKMASEGGRDTEKDLYGNWGGYQTLMSKNTVDYGCPVCGGPITKETYLGGSVYYCPLCQPLSVEGNLRLLRRP